MKTRRLTIFVAALGCLLQTGGCDRTFTPPDETAISNPYSAYAACLQVRETIALSAQSPPVPSNAVYTWAATSGTIMGSGKNVTYLAPDLPGTTTIRLTVSADTALLYSRSFSVFVFKQLVVLKADDMTYFSSSTIAPEWLRYINFIKARNIHASLGLKGYSLTEGTAEYFSFLTSLQHSGLFELWNHGYTHELNEVNSQGQTFDEFQNTSYDFQRQHLTMTQDLARARLHVTLHAFGAPGNDVDSTTTRVIDENSDILVWLNGNPASRKILLNEGSCDIESPIFHPNYARFAAEYNPLTRCYLFGFHPREWDDQGFGEFSRIIDFLIDSGVTFVTPTQYGESFPSRPQILAGG